MTSVSCVSSVDRAGDSVVSMQTDTTCDDSSGGSAFMSVDTLMPVSPPSDTSEPIAAPLDGTATIRSGAKFSAEVDEALESNRNLKKKYQNEERTSGKTSSNGNSSVSDVENSSSERRHPDRADSEGKTKLIYACHANKTEVVTHLLEKGADPNIPDSVSSQRPLEIAAFHGHSKIINLLMKIIINYYFIRSINCID